MSRRSETKMEINLGTPSLESYMGVDEPEAPPVFTAEEQVDKLVQWLSNRLHIVNWNYEVSWDAIVDTVRPEHRRDRIVDAWLNAFGIRLQLTDDLVSSKLKSAHIKIGWFYTNGIDAKVIMRKCMVPSDERLGNADMENMIRFTQELNRRLQRKRL